MEDKPLRELLRGLYHGITALYGTIDSTKLSKEQQALVMIAFSRMLEAFDGEEFRDTFLDVATGGHYSTLKEAKEAGLSDQQLADLAKQLKERKGDYDA